VYKLLVPVSPSNMRVRGNFTRAVSSLALLSNMLSFYGFLQLVRLDILHAGSWHL